jgi:hypothetical protein
MKKGAKPLFYWDLETRPKVVGPCCDDAGMIARCLAMTESTQRGDHRS